MKIVARDVWRKEHTVEVSDLSWRPSVYGVVIEQDKVLLVSLYNSAGGHRPKSANSTARNRGAERIVIIPVFLL